MVKAKHCNESKKYNLDIPKEPVRHTLRKISSCIRQNMEAKQYNGKYEVQLGHPQGT